MLVPDIIGGRINPNLSPAEFEFLLRNLIPVIIDCPNLLEGNCAIWKICPRCLAELDLPNGLVIADGDPGISLKIEAIPASWRLTEESRGE